MGLSDRIKEEMYVDTASLLEEEFERAKDLFDIYEDNTVALADDVSELGAEERILTYLVAQQYVAEADEDEDPTLPYGFFYEQIDKTDSTVRDYFSDLVEEGLVAKGEGQGQHELVIERLTDVIGRIEGALETDKN